ncbi:MULTISPECIES: transposase [unclassified Streptomyces]|uniref:transposase n=1 Tax=unclassified Streptomyces TaxID=2593676 RepID=UPI00332B49AC
MSLTDAQWAKVEPLLPDRAPRRGGRWRDHRQVIDAIAFKYRTGTPWMDLPEEFGSCWTSRSPSSEVRRGVRRGRPGGGSGFASFPGPAPSRNRAPLLACRRGRECSGLRPFGPDFLTFRTWWQPDCRR